MAKLTLGQKAQRTLLFLIGLRNGRTVAKLSEYGFSDATLQEGWTLLRAVGKTQLDADPSGSGHDPDTLKALDLWENKWFAIASLTLTRHAPAANDWLFKNLSQTEGPAVIISVGTFIDRLAKLDKPEAQGGLGAAGKAARKLLTERGLTAAVISQAKTLITTLGGVHGPLPNLPDLEAEEAQLVESEKAMWGWYLEWSGIARKVITQRVALRQLGFLRNGRPSNDDDPVDDLADDGDAAETDPAEDPGAEADAAPEKPVAAPKAAKKPA